MIQNGARPQRIKRKDFDYIPSFHPQLFAGVAPYPQFPTEYLTDKLNWFPNQNAEGKPYACTSYSTVRLARILGFLSATVDALEALTHANDLGGYGVIDAIDMARKVLNWFGWRFIIHATGPLDYTDAFRLAQVSGVPEQRAITWGTPWFPSWEAALMRGEHVIPIPTDDELKAIRKDPKAFGWHDHVLDGWSQNFDVAPGKLLYRDLSHQGPTIDYVYFPREVINVVQNLDGTIAVTATSAKPPVISTISLPAWFWSLYHSWMYGY